MNRVWIVALMLAGSLSLVANAHAQDVPKIATANPGKIFNDMQETNDLKQKLDADQKDLNAQQKAKEDEVTGLNAALKQLQPGSPQYNDKRKELIQKAVELDTWKKVTQAQVQDQQKFQMKALFDKIADAVKAVATQQKLDLVITETNVDFPQDMDQINLDQLRALINQRNVMYSSGKLDISAQVTAKLDADYKSHSAGTPPPLPAPEPAK